jgi:hypothetical protein
MGTLTRALRTFGAPVSQLPLVLCCEPIPERFASLQRALAGRFRLLWASSPERCVELLGSVGPTLQGAIVSGARGTATIGALAQRLVKLHVPTVVVSAGPVDVFAPSIQVLRGPLDVSAVDRTLTEWVLLA